MAQGVRNRGIRREGAAAEKELLHRLRVERGAIVLEAREEQVLLAVVGIHRQVRQGQVPPAAAQNLDHG